MSVARRLDALEASVQPKGPGPCPGCGADWPGAVVWGIRPDGSSVPTCLACAIERPEVEITTPTKAYPIDLIRDP